MIACGPDAKGRGLHFSTQGLSVRSGGLVVTPQSVGLFSWPHPTTGHYLLCGIFNGLKGPGSKCSTECCNFSHLMEYLHLIWLPWGWDNSRLPTLVPGPTGILAMPIQAHRSMGRNKEGVCFFSSMLVGSRERTCGSCCSANSSREVRAYLNVSKCP